MPNFETADLPENDINDLSELDAPKDAPKTDSDPDDDADGVIEESMDDVDLF